MGSLTPSVKERRKAALLEAGAKWTGETERPAITQALAKLFGSAESSISTLISAALYLGSEKIEAAEKKLKKQGRRGVDLSIFGIDAWKKGLDRESTKTTSRATDKRPRGKKQRRSKKRKTTMRRNKRTDTPSEDGTKVASPEKGVPRSAKITIGDTVLDVEILQGQSNLTIQEEAVIVSGGAVKITSEGRVDLSVWENGYLLKVEGD